MAARVVITGCGRTGTSLCMQTLRFFALPVAGLEYHEEAPRCDLHPHGEWGFPYAVTADGIAPRDYEGQAIKLFPNALSNTPHEAVESVIVCDRDKVATVRSLERLMQGDAAKLFAETHDALSVAPVVTASMVYDYAQDIVRAWLVGYTGPVLRVNYEQFIKNPWVVAGELAAFVGYGGDLEFAVDNVIRKGK